MNQTRPLYLPIDYQDGADHGRILLRDGTSATVRLSTRSDYKPMRDFYQRLSPASRRMRFFSESKPGEDVISSLCDSEHPDRCMTLVVYRHLGGEPRIVATASYIAMNAETAEFAVAVDDTLQGKGLGGALLERLSVLAVSHGFTKFNACTHMNNTAMLDVFRHSGFEVREQPQEGMVEVSFSVLPVEKSVSHALQRDRLFTKASIRPFFHPAAVAVIAEGPDAAGNGRVILNHLLEHKFSGDVYAVVPGMMPAAGVRVIDSIGALPPGIDLAIIALPCKQVEGAVDACADRGVRALVVTSTGYAETGGEGRKRQEKLVDTVRGHGMRLLGPNSLGLINNDSAVNLNASTSGHVPARGRVALSSQSGGLGMTLLQMADRRKIGLSMFVSMGNKADVTGNDLLYFWEDDASTDVIMLYLESFGNPKRFGRIAREVSRRKPIVCMKAGSYRSSREEHAVDALFNQTGVIRVRTIEEMFDTAALLGHQPLPGGRRVSIVTNSRGSGVLAADACVSNGLEIAYLNTREKRALKGKLPEGAALEGIIDLTASATPDHYRAAVETALKSDETDSIILLYAPSTPAPAEPVLDALVDALSRKRELKDSFKTVVPVMMTDGSGSSVIHHRGFTFPCYAFPEKAAHTLAAAHRYREWRDEPAGVIPNYEDIDLEAVRGLLADHENRDASGELQPQALEQVLLTARLPVLLDDIDDEPGLRLMLDQHQVFGPVLALSVSVAPYEALQDYNYRMVPLTDTDARFMIRGLRGYELLVEFDADLAALAELITRVSFVIEECPAITKLTIETGIHSQINLHNSTISVCV